MLSHHISHTLRFQLMDRALGGDDLMSMVQQFVCNLMDQGLRARLWVQDGKFATAPSKCDCALRPTLSVAAYCAAYGAFARYCPSGELSTKVIDGKVTHIFTPGVCNACGLCERVCRSGALTRSYAVEFNPFEEQIMTERQIGSCRKCGSPALKELDGLCYRCAQEPPMNSLMDNARSFLLGK